MKDILPTQKEKTSRKPPGPALLQAEAETRLRIIFFIAYSKAHLAIMPRTDISFYLLSSMST